MLIDIILCLIICAVTFLFPVILIWVIIPNKKIMERLKEWWHEPDDYI